MNSPFPNSSKTTLPEPAAAWPVKLVLLDKPALRMAMAIMTYGNRHPASPVVLTSSDACLLGLSTGVIREGLAVLEAEGLFRVVERLGQFAVVAIREAKWG